MTYTGVIDFGVNGYERVLAGEIPTALSVRTVPRFQTGHPAYAWLNRVQCPGIGESDNQEAKVSYDVYAVM
jgi:hypothetical protein